LGEAIKEFGWDRDDLVISTKLYWGEHEDGSKGINGKLKNSLAHALPLS
jgi:aryl-alcohol dehydrogenase-like predicted oxidoreductase